MRIMPIDDFEDGHALSATCHEADEPIFLTKNGYGNMVAMSIEVFERYGRAMRRITDQAIERQHEMAETLNDIRTSDEQIDAGKGIDAGSVLAELENKCSKASGAQETTQ